MARHWWVTAGCYIGFVLLFAGLLVTRWFYPLYIAAPVGVEPAASSGPAGEWTHLVDQRIDPNTASWTELMRLPRVGESLAKAIVAYREERQQMMQSPKARAHVVFMRPEDMLEVTGIGPATLQLMREHLRFPAAASEPAD